MLTIPTYLAESTIHGLGLFAGRSIQQGELVWRFDDRCDFRRDDFPKWLQRFVFTDSIGSALDGDNARFMNHSDDPNTFSDRDIMELFAARPIKAGNEITVDYHCENSKCDLSKGDI